MSINQWNIISSRLLKAELKRSGVTYEELARRLCAGGMAETKATVGNKINRGKFSAAFMLAALNAINCKFEIKS